MVVGGSIARSAGGTVTIVYSQRIGRRTLTARKTATIVRGRWSATLRLTGRLARATGRAKVTVSYAGDADTQRATAARAVTKARSKLKKPQKKNARGRR